jgi:hypothetical protein
MSQQQVIFDKSDQLKRVRQYLIPGESLYAVFDCKGGGTGFVGITDQRVIFYDQAFFRKKKSMISIPYNRVIGISSADEGTFLKTSEITLITSAGQFSFEFRGAAKAHDAYRYIMNQILNEPMPQLKG